MSGGPVKMKLVLGSHAHVPTGAPDSVFEKVYERTLRPFVSTLYKYPKIQAVLHYSGALLHWVERSKPELFMLIEDMVSRKQAEILGGGFYEPMFPLIPLQDRIGQIELLTTYLRRHFGKRPAGCWIPSLAWEQHLVSPLCASGMSYTFLGENQFRKAGVEGADLFAPCISEDLGKIITVFPIAHSVEASLAVNSVSLVLEDLGRRIGKSEEKIVSIFPEKPVFSEGEAPDYIWNRFFEELSLSEALVECALPGKLVKGLKNLKKLTFPDSSGGATGREPVTPRRFLIDNPDANAVYAKMIFTSVLINQLRGDKSRKLSAREELWKAQVSDLFYVLDNGDTCNNICRHYLRKAAYRSLIEAEWSTREKGKFTPSLIAFDFDFDGIDEYLFQDARINCYLQAAGAGVFELDYLPKTWNYLDSGSGEVKGRGPCRRTAFADFLLPPIGVEDGIFGDLKTQVSLLEGARLCFTEQYAAAAHNRSRGKIGFTLNSGPGPLGSIEISKCFSLKKDTLTVNYSLTNRSKESETFSFVPEINLSFAGEGEEFARFFLCNTTGASGARETPPDIPVKSDGSVFHQAASLKIQDLKNEVQINLLSVKSFDGCIVPARSGEYYQSDRILPLFAISLGSGESWENEFTVRFSH